MNDYPTRYCFQATVKDDQLNTVVYDCSWPANSRRDALQMLIETYGDRLVGFRYLSEFPETLIQ